MSLSDDEIRSVIPATALGQALDAALCDMAVADPKAWGYLIHGDFPNALTTPTLKLLITPKVPRPMRNLDYDYIDQNPVRLQISQAMFDVLEERHFFERLSEELPGLAVTPAEKNPLDFGMSPVCFAISRDSLFDAFNGTRNAIFMRRFTPVKLWGQRYARASTCCAHSSNRESDIVSHFVAAQITATLPQTQWLNAESLARLPSVVDPVQALRRPKVFTRLNETKLADAADSLKGMGIEQVRFLGSGAHSIAFAAPRSDHERYVFTLSPDDDAWPDTPFHLPAFVQKDMGAGAFWKLSLELSTSGRIHYECNQLYHIMNRIGLSTNDVAVKNIGLYNFETPDGKAMTVPLIYDWGAASELYHPNSAALHHALSELPYVEPWRAAQRDLARRALRLQELAVA